MKTQRTLVLIKPDGVQRHLVGEILHRFERAGLKLVGLKLVWATPELISRHYTDDPAYLISIGKKTIAGYRKLGIRITETPLDIGRRVRSHLSRHLSVSPVVAMVLQGTNAIQNVRQLIGSTDPVFADIGSIRGDLTIDTIQLADLEERGVRNLVHASGDEKEADREIGTWFSPEELYDYRTVMDVVLHDEDWDRPSPGLRPAGRLSPRLRTAGRLSPRLRTAGRLSPRLRTAGRLSPRLRPAGRPSPRRHSTRR